MSHSNPRLSHVLVPVFLVAASAPLADFVFTSHTNPRFWDIVLFSLGLALFVGVSGSVVFLFITRWYEGKLLRFGSREALLCSGMLFALAVGAAASILAANRPERIKADIPVTYAFNCQSKLPPDTIQFESSEAQMAYATMSQILRRFSEKDPGNAARVQGLSNVGAVNMDIDAVTLLRDMSEYLPLYWLSHPSATREFSDVLYRGGGRSRLAVPEALIRGERVLLADVGGDFNQNSFLGYADVFEPDELGVSLPKGMDVTVEHADFTTSRIRLANDYVAVTIGIEIAWHRGGGIVLLEDQHFGQSWYFGETSDYAKKIEAERRARYFIGQVVVHFDAEFDRVRYGFSEMRAHEAWVKDLLAYLERRFAWGAIDYVSFTDTQKERWLVTTGCLEEPQ